MGDALSFAWMKAKGWTSYNLVRWFPLPLGMPKRSLIYRASARLWGNAYTGGTFNTVAEWREFRSEPRP